MRGLLAMMLIFIASGAAAIWWGASTLRTSALAVKSEPATQPTQPPAEGATRLNPSAQSPAPQPKPAKPVKPSATPPSQPATTAIAANEPASQLQHQRIDPLARAEQALQRDPFHPLALRDAARVSLERGDRHAAITYLARLIVVEPEDFEARTQLAELASVNEAWTTVIDALRPIEPQQRTTQQWRQLARAQTAAGQLQAAREAWASVLEREPQDSAAAVEYAGVLLELDELDRAEAALDTALQANPRSVPALNLMGSLQWRRYEQSGYRQRDAFQRASTAWQASLNIDSAQPNVAENLQRMQKAPQGDQ